MREADKSGMQHRHDPVWTALEGLRHSEVVRETRCWAALRPPEASRFVQWRMPRLAWPAAAFTAALAALALVFLLPRGDVISTDVGEIRRATLADGTVVMLNTDTRLRVTFHDRERNVTLLSGQARFDVAHDASRPFRVIGGGMTVTAIGTAFDVVALPRRTAVTLIEGKVLVESDRSNARPEIRRTVLAPGQQVVLASRGLTPPAPAKLDTTLAWQRQLIDLSGVPLAEALDEVNRYSKVKIVVPDASLATARVSGVFKAGDVEAVTTALQVYFGLKVAQRDDRRIVLERP